MDPFGFVNHFLVFILYFCCCYSSDPSLECEDSLTIRRCIQQKKAYSSIINLHKRLDRNKDGNIDFKETNGFVSQELEYTVPSERILKLYESDNHIDPRELWDCWLKNDAYNWSVYDVNFWLISTVELPQLVDSFARNGIDGRALPLLIDDEFVVNELAISSPIFREKLSIKALDLILFGPPRIQRSMWIDLLLGVFIISISISLALSYTQQKKSKIQMKRMSDELKELNSVINFMTDIRKESDNYQSLNFCSESKSHLQLSAIEHLNSFQATCKESSKKKNLHFENDPLCFAKLQTKEEKSDTDSQLSPYISPAELIARPRNNNNDLALLRTWLQITFEIESAYYNQKRAYAEKAVKIAQENHDKLRKKANSILGSFKYIHDASFEIIERDICDAKALLVTVKQDLKERVHRWTEIQRLTGLSVLPTPGLELLRFNLIKLLRHGSNPSKVNLAPSSTFEDSSFNCDL